MKMDISIRLAVAAVASVFLFTSCPGPLVKPKPVEPPAPEYKVQYSYLKADGTAIATPTDIRVYNTTKDGVAQPGYAVTQLAQPGVYSILFTDDVTDNNADFLQLFFVSGGDLPFRIVNKFTVTDETGQKTQETVVGIPSEYDDITQTFDVTFFFVQDRSEALTLQDVVLNKGILEARHGVNKYKNNLDEYMNYLLVGGSAVAYALQCRMAAGENAWTEAAVQETPLSSPVPVSSHLTLFAGWSSFWKVVCNVVAVVSFAVATAVKEVATVINQPVLYVVAAAFQTVGIVASVIASSLETDTHYDSSSTGGGGAPVDPPLVFIWEVGPDGTPIDIPNSSKYFANDGIIHLHVEDDVNTEKYLKVETSLGSYDTLTVQQNSMSQKFDHVVDVFAATDTGLGSSIFDKSKRTVSFHKELYLKLERTTEIYDYNKSVSYVFLTFMNPNVIMKLNGQDAKLVTELEDASGKDVEQECHNSFKINICESERFCQAQTGSVL